MFGRLYAWTAAEAVLRGAHLVMGARRCGAAAVPVGSIARMDTRVVSIAAVVVHGLGLGGHGIGFRSSRGRVLLRESRDMLTGDWLAHEMDRRGKYGLICAVSAAA